MATRAELLTAIRARYQFGSRSARRAILDEFVAVTGYHRKHAIRLLADRQDDERRCRARRYGDAVRDALIILWEASDRVCSKRLKPMIPVLVPALERHGQLRIDAAVRSAVLDVSAATIDRLLSEARIAAGGGRRRRAGFSSAVRRSVPVRTFADWNDPPPGFVEIDFVAHGGASSAGAFAQTLVLTDIATGWTECVPVVVRAAGLVIEALKAAQSLFPFPLKGVDFDNDGTFMNEQVIGWCRAEGLEVTRARAPTARTIRPGWSRRTAPSSAASLATAVSKARPPRRRSPDSTRRPACTRTSSNRPSSSGRSGTKAPG